MSATVDITLTVNGEQVQASVAVRTNLVDFLREQLVDGVMVRGCLMLAVQADGTDVTTIEGYGEKPTGKLLQSAFVKHNALQCGFCTPGMLASSMEYIEKGGSADRDSIRQHMSGNYCRCTGYQSIVDAVASVIDASDIKEGAGQ